MRNERIRGYLIAIGLSAAAVTLRFMTARWTGDIGLLFTLYIATLAAAAIGGLGPGLVATVLTGFGAALLLPPAGSLWVELPQHRALVGTFLAISVITSVLTDRTQRARLQLARALDAERESSARVQGVVEAAVDAIAIIDDQGRIQFVNPALERIFGYPAGTVIGQNVNALMPEPYHSEHDAYLAAFRITGNRKIIGIGREVEGRRRDGGRFPLHLAVSEIEVDERRMYAGIMRDLSSSKALEAQLLQAQKMEAIGTLAGGVAHDFNNLLTTILGSVELELAHSDGSSLQRSLQRIKLAATRGEALAKQLLAFSRKQVSRPELLDINSGLLQARELFERLLTEDIAVTLDIEDEAGAVRIDPGQLDQVIINLVVNARDAMPRGGGLRLATGRRSLDAVHAEGLGLQAGEYVALSIQDTGVGIPAEIRSRVFEPFFTTKEQGTGLGLSTVLGIIQRSGGAIVVDSHVGSGTSLEVLLPRVAGPVFREESAPAAGLRHSAVTGTILVVEDDPMIRDLITEVLELQGHRVIVAESAGAALERDSHEPLDLLITDVVMPGMTGFELSAQLRSSSGILNVIYMSGYTDQILVDRGGQTASGETFLRKPFGLDELVEKVNKALGMRELNARPR